MSLIGNVYIRGKVTGGPIVHMVGFSQRLVEVSFVQAKGQHSLAILYRKCFIVQSFPLMLVQYGNLCQFICVCVCVYNEQIEHSLIVASACSCTVPECTKAQKLSPGKEWV